MKATIKDQKRLSWFVDNSLILVLDVEVRRVDPDVKVSVSEEVSNVSSSRCGGDHGSCWSRDSYSTDGDSFSTDGDSHTGHCPSRLTGSDGGADSAGDERLDLIDNGGDKVLVAEGAGG